MNFVESYLFRGLGIVGAWELPNPEPAAPFGGDEIVASLIAFSKWFFLVVSALIAVGFVVNALSQSVSDSPIGNFIHKFPQLLLIIFLGCSIFSIVSWVASFGTG
jgi:hypothetical protein